MPEPIQTPEDATALIEAFRLVGRFPLSIDETVVPVVVLRDFSATATDLAATNALLEQILEQLELLNAVLGVP